MTENGDVTDFTPTQPTKMNPHMVNRHVSLAIHPCNTRAKLFTPQSTTRVNSTSPSSIHLLSSILRGTLVPNKARGDRHALLWRQWSSDSNQLRYIDIPTSSSLDPLMYNQLRYIDIPTSSSLDPLMCIRDCMWEQDEDTPPSR